MAMPVKLTYMCVHLQLNLAAMGMVVAISLVVIWGVKQSSLINSVLLVIKLSVLCFFIVHCFTKFQLSHFSPLLPEGITGVFKVKYCPKPV